MNKKRKIIYTALFTAACIGAFFAGRKFGQDHTEKKTIPTVYAMEVVPDDYIRLDQCIPLADINGKFTDADGYTCVELVDIGNQLDDPENAAYSEILAKLPDYTADVNRDFLDLTTVSGYEIDGNGTLHIYTASGNEYTLK